MSHYECVSDAEDVPPPVPPPGGGLLSSEQFTSTGGAPGAGGTGGTQNGPAASSGSRKSKRLTYASSRRYSTTAGHGLPLGTFAGAFGGCGPGLSLQLPQLDGIQRTQKILDMRLQNLQAQSDQLNYASGNARIKEEIMHVRQLIGENQKALSSIVKAVSQMQEQVAMLNSNMEQWILAQASGREIRTVIVEERSSSAKSRRKERRERERDRERESLVREV
ncbi:unnamed protein product [Echinostoma caproni]|uniref:Uncharacterized protein n=1 Tax=Echinostoma caproni TaxID=27848 RepID=A0A3P8K9L5_9TREM|nr:unnamed protein product [Echinostoma caproni]